MNADAVQAAAVAIHRTPLSPDNEQSSHMPPDPSGWEERAAEAAVAAAEPIIRAQIAAEIEERKVGVTDQTDAGRNILRGLATAARIARGGAS